MASNVIYIVTIAVIVGCFFATWFGSGFHLEERKFKGILATFVLVMVFQFLIFDPLRFLVIAIDAACWPGHQRPPIPDKTAKGHTRMDYLSLRLRSLRSQLMITDKHRNEELNLKYRTIVRELWVYGKVFLITLIINVALDEFKFHNYDTLMKLMKYNHKGSIGLSPLLFLHQLYPFIEHTLINGFLSNDYHRLNSHYYHINATKLLGVVRIRQLRDNGEPPGLNNPEFTEKEYSEGWRLPHVRHPYSDKYWSIYLPWLPMTHKYNYWEQKVLNFTQLGYFASYPELKGYVVTLRDTKDDSIKVLTYMYENNWLDERTAAVFFDFTLYNTDANLFSVCSIRVECLPYGILKSSIDINVVSMTTTAETLAWPIFLFFVAYIIIWLQLGTEVIVPLWFEPKRVKKFWVKVDLLILFLSIAVIGMMMIKTNVVVRLMNIVEMANTHDFIDFRVPARLNDWNAILMGFLVCLTTLRLWKVMQFTSIFQIFTMTLSLASTALLNTAGVICIFMMGFGIATVCINGNNSENFISLTQALTSIMCFAFGFSDHVEPEDLFQGGRWLGILIYGVMSFTIAILLTNVFVSILSNYFIAAKTVRDRNRRDEISFWEFLCVEYADAIRFTRSVLRLGRYNRKNRTVAENIKHTLDLRDAAAATARFKKGRHHIHRTNWNTVLEAEEYENKAQEEHRDRISRTYTIAAILQTQMEIAERTLFGDADGNIISDSDEEGTSGFEQDLPRQYQS